MMTANHACFMDRPEWREPPCFQCAKGRKAPLLLPGKVPNSWVLFTPFYARAVDVPRTLVHQCPSATKTITRPVICDKYSPHAARACSFGRRCQFYHVGCDDESLEESAAHVRWVYSCASDCKQARTACFELTVYGGDADVPERVVASEFLQTRAVLTPLTVVVPAGTVCSGDVVYACHMFDCHGICPLGCDCPNAHRIVVDSALPPGSRVWAKPLRAVHTGAPPERCAAAAADVQRGARAHPFYTEGAAVVAGVDGYHTSNVVGTGAACNSVHSESVHPCV